MCLSAATACGTEPALSPLSEAQDGGLVAEPQPSAPNDESGGSDGVTSHGDDTAAGNDSEAPSYLVDAADATQEVTQVYNGETHLVGDAPATLRARSDDVVVFVQDELASQVTDAQLDGFLRRLMTNGGPSSHRPDLGILPANESVFGALRRARLPDGKQRVFIVDTAGAGDGYLCGWCTYPDLHLDAHLVGPLDGEQALSISAHELYHAIHRGYDADEEVWMDESLAEAAMTVNGFFTDVAWLSDYLGDVNRDWGPSGLDVTTVHYGACLAWGTYLWEQGGAELMKAVTSEQANGWDGLDAALESIGETRSGWELFLELGAALYFDDPERGFGLRSFDLPRTLRVTALTDDRTETIEPYGFLHYEVSEGTKLTVAGEGITAQFVADASKLVPQSVELAAQFTAPADGLLLLTSRARAGVSIHLE